MPRLACTLVTLLLLAPACGDDASGAFLQAEDSAGHNEATAAGKLEEEAPDPTRLLECEVDIPCEFPFANLHLDADAGLTSHSYSSSDRCIFTALAGDAPALIETVAEFSDATAYLDYALVGGRVALRQASGESDAAGRWQKRVFRCELQSSEFFTACLKSPSAQCLDPEQWVVACEPLDNLVCPG